MKVLKIGDYQQKTCSVSIFIIYAFPFQYKIYTQWNAQFSLLFFPSLTFLSQADPEHIGDSPTSGL